MYNISKFNTLLWLTFLCAVLLILANGSVIEDLFNTDALYLPALYRDIFVNKISFSGWKLPPAPYFFPDMFLFFILNAVLKNFIYAVFLYAVIQATLVILSIRYLLVSVLPDKKQIINIISPLFGIICIAFLRSTWFYHYLFVSGIHTGTIILTIFAAGLLIRFIVEDQKGWYRFLNILLLSILALLSDYLFITIFTIPAFFLFYYYFLQKRSKLKKS